ncbi:MAG: exodeoxyribonuclease VII small subunit [Chloroflexi bacterium]|jgi:exodeoxyribonuclease VII small subunit|nr:exodeoxyribonuclease VII small subunit [Chloroflexota bacterium]
MQPIEDSSFEQALAELEATVEKMESGELNLDETVAVYERGRALAAHCQKLLDDVSLRVEQLAPDGEGGHAVAPFEPQ